MLDTSNPPLMIRMPPSRWRASAVLMVRLRGALSVHHFRRKFGRLAEIDEIGGHRIAWSQRLEVGEFHFYDIEFHAAEERGR
jgi:hypothetical protein